MGDTCGFLEHNNIANFFRSDCFTFVFLPGRNNFLFMKTFTHITKGKTTYRKEKMKQKSFFASALLIVLLSCLLCNTMVKEKFLIISQL